LPFIGIFIFTTLANSGRTLFKFIILILLFTVLLIFWWLQTLFQYEHTYSIQNNVIAFITYGSFILLIVLPKIAVSDKQRYIILTRYFLVFQSIIGIFQILMQSFVLNKGFDGASGDVVQGTLNIFSFISKDQRNFNNVIFAINLVFLIFFYLPFAFVQKKFKYILLGLLALLFASVMHVITTFLCSIIITTFIFYFNRFSKRLILMSFLIVFLGISMLSVLYYFQPKNLNLFQNYFNQFYELRNPKVIVTKRTLVDLTNEEPRFILFGLGLGQFSSRASLIGTGRYFGNFNNPSPILPFLSNEYSSYFKDYIFDLWHHYENHPETYGGSAMSKPFYSILSLITEIGIIPAFLIFLFLLRFIFKLRSFFADKRNPYLQRLYAFIISSTIWFLFIISFVENYLEVTQAILVGLLLIKIFNPLNAVTHENSTNSQQIH
ncbi:MAG: hypothetical protein NZ516_11095, partial [Raineya sp.]|nr:hypothetical protein [Raineya sp.]